MATNDISLSDNEQRRQYLIMNVFYEVIVDRVESTDVMIHLHQQHDSVKSKYNQIRKLDKDGKRREAMVTLLDIIDKSDEPGKWRSFIDSLKEAGYEHLYNCLEYLKDIPGLEEDKQYKLIGIFNKDIITQVGLEHSGILPLLRQHNAITEHQHQRLRNCIRNNCEQDAWLDLFSCIHNRIKNWYCVLLEAFIKNGHTELVNTIDPDFLSEKDGRQFYCENIDYKENVLTAYGDAYDLCDNGSGNDGTDQTRQTDIPPNNMNIPCKSYKKEITCKIEEPNISVESSKSESGEELLGATAVLSIRDNTRSKCSGISRNTKGHEKLLANSLQDSRDNSKCSEISRNIKGDEKLLANSLQDSRHNSKRSEISRNIKSDEKLLANSLQDSRHNSRCLDVNDISINTERTEELLGATAVLDRKDSVKRDEEVEFVTQFKNLDIPANSIETRNFASGTFKTWQRNSMRGKPGCKKFHQDLLDMDNDTLNEALIDFINEVKHSDGQEFKGDTIYKIIIVLQYCLRGHGRNVNFLEDDDFKTMRDVLKAKCTQMVQEDSGSVDIISEELEEILWRKGFLGSDTPQQLLDTILYLVGLHFVLRTGMEHRKLKVSQLVIHGKRDSNRYLVYTPIVSKSNPSGLKRVIVSQKRENPQRCPVLLYEKYLSLRPSNCKHDALYLQPQKNHRANKWYTCKALDNGTLHNIVNNMCSGAGFSGNFSNDSLRTTEESRLCHDKFEDQSIPDKTATKKTGPRSNSTKKVGYHSKVVKASPQTPED